MFIVAILTVRKSAIESFRRYERFAVSIMATYGGRMERAIVLVPQSNPELHREIHLLSFPDDAAFQAYRQDRTLAEYSHLRHDSVLHTDIYVGEGGPDYGADGPGVREP